MYPTPRMRILPRFVRIGVLALIPLLAAAGFAQDDSDRHSPPAAINLYSDAASFQNNGAFDLAADEWEKFLKQFPSDPLVDKARHYAGVCRLQLKQYEAAIAHFELVAAKGKDFESAEDAHLNLGWCQYLLGSQGKSEQYTKAAETFATLVKLFPKCKYVDQALFYEGESLYALNRKAEAVKAYRQLVDQHPKSPLRPDGLYVLGVTLEELKQYPEAGTVYDTFIQECSDNALITEVRMRKAETILQAGQFAEAEKGFAEVAAVDGFEAADHAMLRQAFCAAKQNKFLPAGEIYSTLLDKFPDSAYHAEATMSAGRCFYRGSDFGKASTWLQKVIDQGGPDAPEAAHWLGRIDLQQGNAAKASERAASMLPKATQSAFLVNLLMDQADASYAIPEQKGKSIQQYLQIVADHGDHELAPQALYNAAFACWELDRFQEGIQHAEDFLKRFQKNALVPDIQHVSAECQLRLGNQAEAETIYRNLIEQHKEADGRPKWSLRLGLILHLEGKYGDAAKWLNTVIPTLKDKAQIAEAQFLLGISHFHQDQFPEAEAAFSASLAAAPKWKQADETRIFLARVQHQRGETEEAIKNVRQVIADFPNSTFLDQAHYRLGEFCYAQGDYPAAIEAYETLTTKWPDSAFAQFAFYGQGWALLKDQKFRPAADRFTTLIDKYPQHQLVPDSHFGRAMCRRQLKEYKNAIADIDLFLKSNPPATNRADALHEKLLSEVGLKDSANAVQTAESLLKESPNYRNAANVLYELAFAYKDLGKQDKVVATFRRLATEHPDSPLAAEAHWRVGEALFEGNELEKAAEQYSQAITKSPPGEVHELATHKLGWAYFRLDKFHEALEQFQAQVKAYPNGDLQPDGLFMQAECLFQLKKFKEALPLFSAASQTTLSKQQMQVLTLLHGGQCAAELKEWEESLRFLDQIPEKFPKAQQLADALGKRGWAKQNLDRLDEAVEDYTQAVAASRTEAGAYAQYMIGEIQFQQKHHDEAIRSFLRVMYGFGGENAPKEVQHWQAMAGYEAGRCAEVQKLTANAKKYYSFVVQRFAEHSLAAKAKERLDALTRL